jgi:CheY-like chemotaxis protein
MLKESLEQDDDYQATVVHTGREALEIASQETFDLAIVDLGIDAADGVDGQTTARLLRKEQPDLRLMLIPLEGTVLPEDLTDLDVQGTLPKPFFLPDLPEMLDTALTKPLEKVPEPEPESAPPPQPGVRRVEPAAPAPPADASHKPSTRMTHELEGLAREINADAALVTRGAEVVSSAGRLDRKQLETLAQIVSDARQLSRQAAQMLGREQLHFEQSVESDEYMLYSLTVVDDVMLAAVLRPNVTLGFLRHQMKRTVRRLRNLMA